LSQTRYNFEAKSLTPVYERLEAWLRRCLVALGRVPVRVWQLLIKLSLLIWLSHTLAQMLWLWIPQPELPEARLSPNALAVEQSGGARPSVDIEALSSLEVFGRVDQENLVDDMDSGEDETQGIEDEAVDTDLDLVLRGLMGSSENKAARAIIADGPEQAIYAPGDELPVRGDVTVEKILPLRVILNNNGRYESLWLYADGNERQSLAARQPVENGSGRSRADSGQSRGGDESETDRDRDSGADEQAVEEADEQLGRRVGSQSLSDVVSMSIHREEGKIVGYRIRPGRDRDLFDSLGLETGDLVKAVNGSALSSPQKVMEIYRQMGDASSASLLIERDGQELTIDIDLE